MENAKIKKTKNALYVTLSNLLCVKDIRDITVIELCKEAGINKSTFYLHYKDIYECAEDFILQIVSPIVDIICQNGVNNMIKDLPNIWSKILQLNKEQGNLYKPFFNSPSLSPLIYKVRTQIIDSLISRSTVFGLDDKDLLNARISITFFVNGFLGIIEENGRNELSVDSLEEFAKKLQKGFLDYKLFKEDLSMWADESIFYQIYPLGFCGAPFENDGVLTSRILKVNDWIPHINKLGANAIYFSPVFESDTHGYNTRDYRKIDCRLGTNDDFKNVCDNLHKAGIKVVLDGVFNHVGRGFFAFQDVLKNREASPYKDWFARIDFGGNSNYNDGLWYEGWEGNYDLVKLNLRNEEVINYIFDSIKLWVDEFDIDGIRLDVAYCLDKDFLKRLRHFCNGLKADFWLLGELLHGDYNQFVNDEMLHSCTNYECYKGLFSSFNSMNMFEIVHSLLRQFGPENWTLYKGKHLLTFVDNHDVSRIASNLNNENHLPLIYALAFGMPGIPCVYYGSEWGAKAHKNEGDSALRACFDAPIENELSDYISKLANAHKNSKAICYGDFKSVVLTNHQCVFERTCDGERVLIAINASADDYTTHFDSGVGSGTDLITGETVSFEGGLNMKGYSAKYIKC